MRRACSKPALSYKPWSSPYRLLALAFRLSSSPYKLLALAYRCVYGVLGSYLTARFAPHSPMRHVWVGGGIGFALSTVGAIRCGNCALRQMLTGLGANSC